MTAQSQSLVIYQLARGRKISVPIEKDTVWLSLDQLAQLLDRDKSVISRHIKNIFSEKELYKKSVVANFATTAPDGKTYKVDYYNLDVIISVGYHVKSLRGTQFRIWATKTLRDHILHGYSLNQHRLHDVGLAELERAVALIHQTLDSKVLTSGEAQGILRVITDYAQSWILFHKYDEGELPLRAISKPRYLLTYTGSLALISQLTIKLREEKTAAKFVGLERDDHGLKRIVGSINQTYGGRDVYPSVEEKAAHLLYFIIKDHPLIDGNKRAGSLLFLHFLTQNQLLFRETGERVINDNTIVALALLIAQSHPKDKELLIRLTTNLLR
jgi:prophage maintenance system killer protein